MHKLLKNKTRGFSLIEIVVTMAIFGFLLYIITDLLILIINTVYVINQEAYLRNNLENIVTTVDDDLQFANNPSYCINGNHKCITFDLQIPAANNQFESECETLELYNNGGLSNIVKVVNINGNGTCQVGDSGTTTYYLNSQNVLVQNMYFDIEQGNVLFSLTGQVKDRYGKPIFSKGLSVGANIEYSKK